MAKGKKVEEVRRIEFETFRNVLTSYWENSLTEKTPSCFNSCVSILKYRVTIELIEEPKQVLAERLEKLFRECDNHHHYQSLMSWANSIGYEFTGKFGQDKKERS